MGSLRLTHPTQLIFFANHGFLALNSWTKLNILYQFSVLKN